MKRILGRSIHTVGILTNASGVVLAAVVLSLVLVPTAAFGADSWSTSQLTDNAIDDVYPLISGDLVAWSASDGNDLEIFIWRTGDFAPTQLTDNSLDDGVEDIDGDRIVWSSSVPYDGNSENTDVDVYTWKYGDAAPTPLTFGGGVYTSARVSGDRVVWMGRSHWDWENWDIFTWEAGDPGCTRISSNWQFETGARVAGDRVVWTAYTGSTNTSEDIYTWKAGDGCPTPLANTTDSEWQVDIDGDRVAWVSYNYSTGSKLYTWAEGDSLPTIVPTGNWEVDSARVSGDRLAWVGRRDVDGYGHSEIFTWRAGDTAATQVTTQNLRYDYQPEVDGDRIVWQSQDWVVEAGTYLSETDVLTWAVGDATPTCLHDGSPVEPWLLDDPRPQVDGDRVVWSACDGADSEVFVATLQTQAPGIQYSPAALEYGSVEFGTSRTLSISVTNPGDATLEADCIIMPGNAAITTPLSHVSVPPGMSVEVPVVFTPTANCPEVDATLWFRTNVDALDGAQVGPVVLSGTGFSRYVSSGALEPINADGTSVFRAGSTVPVKIILSDRDGERISGASVRVLLAQVSDDITGSVFEAESTSAADTGNTMRETDYGAYIFNLSTKGLAKGTYVLRIVYPDGTDSTVMFGMR
jgi:hypothetical protein